MAGDLLALPLASQAATYSYTDLNPSGFTSSRANGNSGSQQVGYGYSSVSGYYEHALLWSGTASSAVDLNPSGFTSSQANGNSGTQQVGNGSGSATGNNNHALLWSGTAGSVVDLNPSGFTQSYGFGVAGGQQVGTGYLANEDLPIALLWFGTAGSVVDLNPNDFTTSSAQRNSGSQQVGYGSGFATGNNYHALLWSGTADSVVDLNPSGFTQSYGFGISGSQQVGFGSGSASGNYKHALLWSGTASSVVDLGSLLSSDYSSSVALNIDANGNVVGYATYILTGQEHAILWTVAVVPLYNLPPTISAGGQPENQTAPAGNTVVFTVNARSASPLIYQWKYNGQKIPGATNATLTLNSVTAANSGGYSVIVSNPYGSVTSATAALKILAVDTTVLFYLMNDTPLPARQAGKNNLVLVTHGWQPGSKVPPQWVSDLCSNLQTRVPSDWQVVPYFWVDQSYTPSVLDVISLENSVLGNAQNIGTQIGRQIVEQGWQHVHLIAHSAGSALIQSAADAIRSENSSIVIHTTFLDPFLGLDGRGIPWY